MYVDSPNNGIIISTIFGYTKYLATSSHNLFSIMFVTRLQSTLWSPTAGFAVNHKRGGPRNL